MPMRTPGEPDPRPPVRAFVVVMPARDEEAEIGGALTALAAAVRATDLPVTVVTVLDRCTDRTAEVAANTIKDHPGIDWRTVESTTQTLGEVRGEGVKVGRAAYLDLHPDEVWVASTDADSRVPEGWLREQRVIADRGYDLVLGTVEPADDGGHPEAARLWLARHELVDGHTAIHAANLGVRLSAYDAAGGFAATDDSEDARLVAGVRDASWLPWTSTDRTRVQTSARRRGRVPKGFAGFLRRLDAQVEAQLEAQVDAQVETVGEGVAETGEPPPATRPSHP